ncbi:MAG TPA: AMP-binding protein, partial [Pyrinomonadaceae bacterium]|nr:AMP-binding protein [Pyrinomonadaceae bacterium]
MLTNPDDTADLPFEPSTLVELLRWRARHQPDQPAYLFLVDGEEEKASLTYAELDRKARAVAAMLQSSGCAGGRALLLYPSGLDYVVAFFGCLYAQVVAVPAYPPRPSRASRTTSRVWGIVEDAQPAVALCTTPLLSAVETLFGERAGTHTPRPVTTDDLADDVAERWGEPHISSHTLAFLQYTSGSTATPKGVMVSHGNLLHNERLIKLAFQQSAQSVVVGWLPLYHDMGLIGNILHPLYLGVPCVLMAPTAFLLNPLRWLKAVSRYKATTSGGPNFAYDLCVRKITPEQRAQLDLSSWTTAFNGAEPVRSETMERFAAAFEPCGFRREAFSPCYGLAESTLIVTGGARSSGFVSHTVQAAGLEQGQVVAATGATSEPTRSLVGCGQPLLDQQVVIVDPETSALCPPDSIGEIWVSGPSVTHGYWNKPEETAATFHAYLSDTREGPFLRTGDLGFLNNGHLFVVGRLKDMIVIRGRNHFPQDFELTVEQSHPALRAGCGAAFSVEDAGEEALVVVQELEFRRKPDVSEVIDSIRQALSEEHEVQVHSVVLIKPGTIPKTSSGKIQRHACRLKYLSDALEVVGRWQQAPPPEADDVALDSTTPIRDAEDIQAWLKTQLAARLRVPADEIDVTQPIARYGVDSLTAIELTHSIEARLGVILPVVSFLQSPSITQLADKVHAELRASSATNEAVIKTTGQVTVEHPLSYGQRALYFLHRLAPESAAYNISSAVRILSPLDRAALRRAFQSLVDRHASLRTTFDVDAAGEPVQLVHEKAEVSFHEEDAAGLSDEELRDRLAEQAHKPFDLGRGPLLRVHCYRRSEAEHVLLLSVHHIVADFWSLAVLANELGISYLSEQAGTRASLPPLTLQYGDYARWQTEFLTDAVGARLSAYWEKQLAGDLPILNLPTDRPRPAVQSFRGASQPFELDEELARRLKGLSKQHGVTLYVTMLSAFQSLLHRYTGQDDILLGSPTAGRSLAELAGLVGYFVNPVAVRADLSGDPTFAEVLERTRQTVLDAFAHQDYPFALLVERLQPTRDLSLTPVFQAMFILQRAHLLQEEGLASFALGEEGVRMELGTLTIESMNLPQRVAQFDLTLIVAETSKGLSATFEYNADLFDAETIERMSLHFRNLLSAAVADPSRPVSALPLLDEGERRHLLEGLNRTSRDYPRHLCLHQLFERQAARTPDRVALLASDGELTYAGLNGRANRLAHHLISLGIRPEDRVGVMLSRTSLLPITLLAVHKAGAAYVPLDPRYPSSRLRLMCQDAGLRLLLTETALLASAPEGVQAPALCLDSLDEELAAQDASDPRVPVSSRNLSHVIYTSGSTGTPKGVAIEHRSAVCLVYWAREVFTEEEFSGALFSTSVNFDLS